MGDRDRAARNGWPRERRYHVPIRATASLGKVLCPSVKVAWLLINLSTKECPLHIKLTL